MLKIPNKIWKTQLRMLKAIVFTHISDVAVSFKTSSFIFPSCSENFLVHTFKVCLLATDCLNFPSFDTILISVSFLQDIFSWVYNSGSIVLFFSTWKILCLYFIAFISVEKHIAIQIVFPYKSEDFSFHKFDCGVHGCLWD